MSFFGWGYWGQTLRIRRLWIEHFRGVQSLDWTLPLGQKLFVLIGPGDSGKSTILEAVHYLLGDRWNIPFSDTDFHNGDVDNPILIRAALVDLTPDMLKESAFGLLLSGIDEQGEVHQDPEDDLAPCLVALLKVEADLEPKWTLERLDGQTRELRSSHRGAFSTFKVDGRTDTQLRWTRTSALGRMSQSDGGDRAALAAASRAAREALEDQQHSSLSALASSVQAKTNSIGGGRFTKMRPGLDTSRSTLGAGLSLYEDVVPLTSFGMGSRRLASLAVQQLGAGSRSVALVDELEGGLEPHRAVRLLSYLNLDEGYSQVLVTTHSPVVVEQAELETLAVVRSDSGIVSITTLGLASEVVRAMRRARPSSLLARRIVVVEGKTEYGIVLACLEHWDVARTADGLSTSAGEGVAIQDAGSGSQAARRSEALERLGYSTAALLDNDVRDIDQAVLSAEASGSAIIRWESGSNTETQVCSGLDGNSLSGLLELAVENRSGSDTVLHDLNAFQPPVPVQTLDVNDWIFDGATLDGARSVIARAAHERKWFKDIDAGKRLGHWLLNLQDRAQVSGIDQRLEQLRRFVFSEGIPSSTEPITDGTGDLAPSEVGDG